MSTAEDATQAPSPTDGSVEPPGLTIGDLARATGLTAEVLRMWEARHGFPPATRLANGHRRYRDSDVALVRQVLARRDTGVGLDRAIRQVVAIEQAQTASVFAQLRRDFPQLPSHRLRKQTLLALSWAIEDECCAQAQRPMLFGAFQNERYYRASRRRWEELARVSAATMVLADFTREDASAPHRQAQLPAAGTRAPLPSRPIRVPLPPDSPMLREWVVVCDAADFPAALAAWEIPGQEGTPDAQRVFEATWTIHPPAVRTAARACATIAQQAGSGDAGALLYRLAATPDPSVGDLASISALFNRVVAYVDRMALT